MDQTVYIHSHPTRTPLLGQRRTEVRAAELRRRPFDGPPFECPSDRGPTARCWPRLKHQLAAFQLKRTESVWAISLHWTDPFFLRILAVCFCVWLLVALTSSYFVCPHNVNYQACESVLKSHHLCSTVSLAHSSKQHKKKLGVGT